MDGNLSEGELVKGAVAKLVAVRHRHVGLARKRRVALHHHHVGEARRRARTPRPAAALVARDDDCQHVARQHEAKVAHVASGRRLRDGEARGAAPHRAVRSVAQRHRRGEAPHPCAVGMVGQQVEAGVVGPLGEGLSGEEGDGGDGRYLRQEGEESRENEEKALLEQHGECMYSHHFSKRQLICLVHLTTPPPRQKQFNKTTKQQQKTKKGL